ncbi:hypothetical protein WA026_017891 [Henosepilachna vigintioctopunctata]|uniref:Uncharacterized protein n=1 Tax=Henosepilachna vigintioctopunctata TaxID=420089 RepID=A0AAW1TVJ0_9CUCU
MQSFAVIFIGAFALVNAGVIVQEHNIVNTPFERTSIVGPSGSITQEKHVPLVETKVHEIVPAVKVVEPVNVLAEPVHEVVPVVNDVALAKVETVAPVVHHVGHPVGVPVFKSIAPVVPEFHVDPEYPVVPSWYSHSWFRSYYPYYNYFPHHVL